MKKLLAVALLLGASAAWAVQGSYIIRPGFKGYAAPVPPPGQAGTSLVSNGNFTTRWAAPPIVGASGAQGNVQYNSGGLIAGDASLNTDGAGNLTATSLDASSGTVAGNLYVGSNITVGPVNVQNGSGQVVSGNFTTGSGSIGDEQFGLNAYAQLGATDGTFVGQYAGNGLAGANDTCVGNGSCDGGGSGGAEDTAEGANALGNNQGGDDNTASGVDALAGNSTGSDNTAVGFEAGLSNTTGSNNVAEGAGAGPTNSTGNFITLIGSGADVDVDGLTNATAVGYGAIVGASNSLVLGNGANVGIGTTTPPYPLSTAGTGSAMGLGTYNINAAFWQDQTNYRGIYLGYDSAAASGFVAASTIGGVPSALHFITYNGSAWADQMTINGTGNVGIGTATPGYPLTVVGASNFDSGSFYSDGSGNVTATSFTGNVPVGDLAGGSGASSSTYWRGDGTWAQLAAGGANAIQYYNSGDLAGDTYFTTDGSGNVTSQSLLLGGGTSAAGNALVIYPSNTSNTYTSEQINTPGANYRGLVVQGFNGQTSNLQEWQNYWGTPLCSISATGLISCPQVSFDSGSFYSDGSGNVTATSFTGSGAGLTNISASNINAAGSNTQVQFNSSGVLGASSYYAWDNSNNTVLVGGLGSSPTAVDGSNRLILNTMSTPNNQTAAQINTGNAGYKGLVVQGSPSQDVDLQEWQNSGGTALDVVNAAGNVGIGTASPTHTLEVAGTFSSDNGSFTTDGSGNLEMTSISANTTGDLYVKALNPAYTSIDMLGNDGTTEGIFGIYNHGGNAFFQYPSGQFLEIDDIGTSAPGVLKIGALVSDGGSFTSNGAGNVNTNSLTNATTFSSDATAFTSDGVGNVTATSYHNGATANSFDGGAFTSDGSGDVTAVTLDLTAAQTTYSGSMSGNAVWSMPFQGASYKKFVINLQTLVDAGGTITYPTAFSQQPYLYGDAAAAAVSSTNTTTFTLSATAGITGNVFVEGY